MGEKIFCRTCKWYDYGDVYGDSCDHPDNFEDTYAAPKNHYISCPRKMNENNDCHLYERRIPWRERLKAWLTHHMFGIEVYVKTCMEAEGDNAKKQ